MAIWTRTGRDNACRMATKCKRVAAVRAMHSEPAVERLHRVAPRDERYASKRRREEEDGRALKLKLGANPVCAVENN